jgi:hypothetical protein
MEMKRATPEQQEFLNKITDKVLAAVKQEIDRCPGLINMFDELRSLGVFCKVDYNINLNVVIREGFVPPKDLSEVPEHKLDELFSDADMELLRKMQRGAK